MSDIAMPVDGTVSRLGLVPRPQSVETVAMVEDVFTELLDVFPSEYIHIGGDECPRSQWQQSDSAKELAAARPRQRRPAAAVVHRALA